MTCLPALLLVASLAQPEPPKPVLTVLYFDNNTGQGEFDVLRKGLADMIITDLVAWDGVSVVEREKLEAVMGELKLQHTASFDKATAVKVGRFLGAQYLLTGSVLAASPELRIDAKLIKTEDASVVAGAAVRGPKDKVFDLEQELVDKITGGIDLKVKNLTARRRAKAPDMNTLMAYSHVLDLSDQGKVEEAQKAIQDLVSHSPSFLMAREKKDEILKRLKDLEKRRADMVTTSALELNRLAEVTLKDPTPLDKLGANGTNQRLVMRMVRGRFLARLLKQDLSWRRNPRVILKGHEAQALKVMLAFVDNQRRLADEYSIAKRLDPAATRNVSPEPEIVNLLLDAKMGTLNLFDPFEELLEFVAGGKLKDGDDYYDVAPTLGDLDPKEKKAVFDELDQRIAAELAAYLKADAAQKQQLQFDCTRIMERKAAILDHLGQTEEAVAEYQRMLDAFPNDRRAAWTEQRIKQLIGAMPDAYQHKREAWARALKEGCQNEMDVRVGSDTALSEKVRRMGAAGLGAQAAELEKACKVTPRNSGAFGMVYEQIADEAANMEDCEAYRTFSKKYLEVGGSIYDLKGRQKNSTPWCQLGDLLKQVMWMHGKLDKNWDFEFDRNLVSILSMDGKQLTINGSREDRPDSLSLYLDATGPGAFTCRLAQWNRGRDERLQGKCTVTLTKLATQKGEHDEGSFTATYEIKEQGLTRRMEMSDAEFRVHRE